MITINNLKEYREMAGISQTELAFLAGVSQRYIAFLEKGDRTPSLKVANNISKVLKKSVDDIFLSSKCTKRS